MMWLFFFLFLSPARAATPDFTIYTYDSFVAKGGLGPEIFPEFEKLCGCRVRALPVGDAAQIVSRLELDAERGKVTAQAVLGIDQQLWGKAKRLVEGWDGWKPSRYERILKDVRVEPGFLPVDYGVQAFMMNRQAFEKAGRPTEIAFRDLLKPQYARSLILEDPRTSTPGLGFLLFSETVLAAETWSFWKNLKSQWLTLTPGWDAAYGLFLKNEAPLVWSYTTSQAYHEEKDQTGHRAVLFKEGNPVQIEGAAWVKGALKTETDRKNAKLFFDFLLSESVQKRIPLKNWMLPVAEGTPLPESFKKLPRARKLVRVAPEAPALAETLKRWERSLP